MGVVVVVEMGGGGEAEGWRREADKKAEVGEEDELSEDEKWVHKRALILQSWSLSGSSRPVGTPALGAGSCSHPDSLFWRLARVLTAGLEHAGMLRGNASAVATWEKMSERLLFSAAAAVL